MAKSKLSKIFNDVSRLPAVRFERAAKMRGISQFYKLPDGVKAADLEDVVILLRPGALVSAVARLLEELNPQLKKIPYNRQDDVANFRFVMGVVSALNIDDISYFMRSISRGGKPAQNSCTKNPTKQMIAFIQAAGCPHMEWAPSRKTLQKICQRIKRQESQSKRVA
jgi:hypothetical protein